MMKQLIFFTLLILYSQYSHSQNYVPMAVDSATWRLGITVENPEDDNIIVLRIEGDSIVDGIAYAKIYHYDTENYILSESSRRLLGLIRDDIDEKKVYGGILDNAQYDFLSEDVLCDWGDTDTFNEQLLYDFGLTEGDTLSSCMFSDSAFIASIDSVSMFGFQRRRLKLNGDIPHTMTEGIGCCMGIFKGQLCLISVGYYAYTLFGYCIGSFSNCDISTSTKEEVLQGFLSIYPNPVSDKLIIDSSIDLRQLFLLDSQGRTVEIFKNSDFINFEKYPSGLYFLKAEDKDGKIYTERVIKH